MASRTSRRQLPDRVHRWRQLAQEAGLPDPLGRALCAYARACGDKLRLHIWRGGDGGNGEMLSFKDKDEAALYAMRRMRPATAAAWRQHVLAGGSLRTLQRSDADQREKDRRDRDERLRRRLSEADYLRLEIRRIRRGRR